MDESCDFVTQKVSRFIGYSYPKTNAKYFMRIRASFKSQSPQSMSVVPKM